MPIEQRTPERVKPTGIICPKDPKRDSDDPEDPPTHTQLEVLEVSDGGAKTSAESAARRKARLRCNECQHEFDVKPWPPRVDGPPRLKAKPRAS